ncbi:MAG: CIA30 family protein [Pseudomonadota bacterium]|nr:CIA30 family protein [Pseudomonadota bacterium]
MTLRLTPKLHKYAKICLASFLLILSQNAMAEQKLLDDFKNKPEDRWKFIADTVMGGISSGQLSFSVDGSANFARMVGKVSTENNGGFIQFRRSVIDGLPANTKGLKLSLRGNGQKYFVHIRTKGTFLPWQYYQRSFMSNEDWSETTMLLNEFRPSGILLRKTIDPKSIKSIGIVAFGRDHEAEIDVRKISFF